MAFQPRELNTLIGCSKRLTAGRRVKARVGYSFFIGVLVYRIYRNNAKRPQFRGVLSWVIAGVICTLVILALTTGLTQPAAAQLAVVAMLFPTLIYFGACVHLSQRWDNISSFLGEMSYPLYLLHIPLSFTLRTRVSTPVCAASRTDTPCFTHRRAGLCLDLVVGGQALRQARAQASYSPI
jgi:hypothetical protein